MIALSERTVYSLERAHGEALGEQRASEKRLRQELSQWKHCHPEVIVLMTPPPTAVVYIYRYQGITLLIPLYIGSEKSDGDNPMVCYTYAVRR